MKKQTKLWLSQTIISSCIYAGMVYYLLKVENEALSKILVAISNSEISPLDLMIMVLGICIFCNGLINLGSYMIIFGFEEKDNKKKK